MPQSQDTDNHQQSPLSQVLAGSDGQSAPTIDPEKLTADLMQYAAETNGERAYKNSDLHATINSLAQKYPDAGRAPPNEEEDQSVDSTQGADPWKGVYGWGMRPILPGEKVEQGI